MKTVVSLRAASLLTLLFCIGHTLGMPWVGSLSAEQLAQIDTVKSVRAETMGFMRSYWDFHVGFGLYIGVNFLVQAMLFWLLAGMMQNRTPGVRPIIALFLGAYLAFTMLGFAFLFWAPIVFSLLISLCLAIALLPARK